MKVKLANEQVNCRAYGLNFDDKGECTADDKLVQSLVDSGVLVEVKAKAKAKAK